MATFPSSAELTLAQLIAAHAEHAPDTVALLAPDRPSLSYHQLLAHVQEVVLTLTAWGVGRSDRVAIVLPNGPEMAAAFLAVSACATSAPLNPAYRAEEFEFYLADLEARAVIVRKEDDSPVRAVAQGQGIPILELSSGLNVAAGLFTLRGGPRAAPVQEGIARPEDVALVLHTSGTTARPKLVPLTHGNLCTSASNTRHALALTQSDRCLNVMPLFHIHGLVGALLSSLAAGGSVVCTPGFSAPQFFPWLEAFRPTWYTAVPTMHQTIVAQAQADRDLIVRCPLRLIRSSSAALPPTVLTQLEATFNAPVIESYGMTEAAHQMASNPLPPGQRKAGSVGKAAGPEVAVMDEAGNHLPAEALGEVVIRGANVTSGYAENPEANATAFTRGWFRTGDQGYLDSDGYLFLAGRLKEMINRGGEKVAPREVDEALLEHPDVAQAVTFAVPHPTLGEDVAAAVVLRERAAATEPMIRHYLFGRLADFKVPSQVLIVDEIPKGATGKVRRIGLAEKFARHLKRGFVAPRNDLEREVADIVAEVLGLARVGVDDNFFALGGDSLRATRVISRLRAALRVNFPIATVFKQPTVAELSDEILKSTAAVDQTSLEEILAELAALSDEEARQLLAAELGGRPSTK
jgi:oxalate---CoA ligase